jgi:hypothetical protein
MEPSKKEIVKIFEDALSQPVMDDVCHHVKKGQIEVAKKVLYEDQVNPEALCKIDEFVAILVEIEQGLCLQNCQVCPLILNRNSKLLTVVFNAIFKKFGDEIISVINEVCPKLTKCFDCKTDDFSHKENCELEKESKKIIAKVITPIMDTVTPDDEHCRMTLIKFIENCESNGFIDYDGFGYYGTMTEKCISDEGVVIPSDIIAGKINRNYPYVYWYNR